MNHKFSFPGQRIELSGDVLFLHFNVTLPYESEFDKKILNLLEEMRGELESQIKKTIEKCLGPQFEVRNMTFHRGSIEILIIIGTIYYAISNYKSFIESIELLISNVKEVLAKFFKQYGPPLRSISIRGSWSPGPALIHVNEIKSAHELDKAKVGYQVAVDLLGILIETNWSRFNAMVVTNSIIIGVLGLTLINVELNPFMFLLIIFVGVIGIILCISWYFLMRRDYEFHDYYMRSAREIEVLYLSPIKTIFNGGKFEKGKYVPFEDKFSPREIKMGYIRLIKTRYIINFIIFLFIVIYIGIIVFAFNMNGT